jgi:hypothetical protein
MPENSSSAQDKYEARLSQAVDNLRGNVKWTLVAFGAIGTTLLAGSQLSSLGKFEVDAPRLWFAVAFALVALGAAAWAVRSSLAAAYAGYTEFYDLDPADVAYVEKNKALLEGFGSIKALRTAYEDCIAKRHADLTAENKNMAAINSNEIWFNYLDGLVDNVLSYIRYNRIRTQVDRSRRELSGASIVVGAALVGFAWAANPGVEHPTVLLKAPVSEARMTLTDVGKRTLAPLLGADCVKLDRIDVLVLGVTTSGSEVLTTRTKDCQYARFTLTDPWGKLEPRGP